MTDAEKDGAANHVVETKVTFDLALSDKRKYPVQEFRAFVHAARRNIEVTGDEPLIHRSVANAVNGLREFLAMERKRVPGEVLFEADRLECQVFAGYDPYFEATNLRGCDRRPVLIAPWNARIKEDSKCAI